MRVIRILANAISRTNIVQDLAIAMIGTWGNSGTVFYLGKIGVSFAYSGSTVANPSPANPAFCWYSNDGVNIKNVYLDKEQTLDTGSQIKLSLVVFQQQE